MLKLNNYPQKIIDSCIKKRISHLKNSSQYDNSIKKQHNQRLYKNKKKIIVPFLKNLNKKIKTISQKFNCATVNKNTKKLTNLIRLGKDKLNDFEKSGIVYKIDCKDCTSTYIGQSSRQLIRRVKEHERDVKNKKSSSAIYNHVKETGHKINFKKPNIIDQEKNKRKRCFSEMLNIHFNQNTMNKMEDTRF